MRHPLCLLGFHKFRKQHKSLSMNRWTCGRTNCNMDYEMDTGHEDQSFKDTLAMWMILLIFLIPAAIGVFEVAKEIFFILKN